MDSQNIDCGRRDMGKLAGLPPIQLPLVTCPLVPRVRSVLNFEPSRAPRVDTSVTRARARKCAAMRGYVRPCADFCPPFFSRNWSQFSTFDISGSFPPKISPLQG